MRHTSKTVSHFALVWPPTRGFINIGMFLCSQRSKLVAGEMVRVKKGEIAPDYGRLKRSEQRKLGYSYAIVYIEADSEDVRMP